MKTQLQQYTDFFTLQGFTVAPHQDGDDNDSWIRLEIYFAGKLKSVFLFSDTTGELIEWKIN